MAKQPRLGEGDGVGELVDLSADLLVRSLADRSDMSASASFVVNRLCREGPLRLTALAAKEGITQPSMTQLVKRLEVQDLVVRLPDPEDGRVSLVGITPHGRDVLDDRMCVRRERLAHLLDALPPEEAHALQLAAVVALPILRKLATNAGCPPDDAREALQ